MAEQLEIPLHRFEPDRPLASAVYLYLTLNRRSICLAHAGGELSEETLARLKAKGIASLRVEWKRELGETPETYPLYQNSASPASAEAPPSAGTNDQVATSPSPQPEIAPATDPLPTDPAIAPVARESEGSILAAPTPSPSEEGQILSRSPTEAESGQVVRASPSGPEPEQDFSSSPQAPEPEKSFAADEREAQDELHFDADGKKAQDELRFDADRAAPEAISRIGGQKKEQEPEPEFVFSGAPAEKKEEVSFRLAGRLEQAKEAMLAGKPVSIRAQQKELMADAKQTALSAAVSREIIKLAAQLQEDPNANAPALRARIKELDDEVTKIEGSSQPSPEVEQKISPDPKDLAEIESAFSQDSEEEALLKFSDKVQEMQEQRIKASAAVQEADESLQISRSSASRDFPIALSRLSVALGHSMGYVNGNYLADLAISAICHFSKRAGNSLDPSALPALTSAVLAEEPSASMPVKDAKEIIRFLELYMDDEESDHSEKEFSRKLFDRTLQKIEQGEDVEVDAWNMRRWEAMLNRGLTMEAHSICTKAAAKATKFVRSTLPEDVLPR